MIRRRAAKDQSAKEAAMRPLGTRAAGAGGSNATMLRLYTDDAPGLKVSASTPAPPRIELTVSGAVDDLRRDAPTRCRSEAPGLYRHRRATRQIRKTVILTMNSDPLVVMVLSVAFVGSVFALHIIVSSLFSRVHFSAFTVVRFAASTLVVRCGAIWRLHRSAAAGPVVKEARH